MKTKFRNFLRLLSRHKAGVRILSMMLSVVLLFYVVPTVIYAEIADALSTAEKATDEASGAANESTYGSIGDLYEVKALREENVKHFHLEDGSFIAAQYSSPVHYLDGNGIWQDIDNVLTESIGEFSDSSSRVKFSKKINGSGKVFTLKGEDYQLTMSFIGGKAGTLGVVYNNKDREQDTELQKMMNLEKLSSKIIYENILDGVDLEYIVNSLDVKENIIVKEKQNSYVYTFELKLKGLDAELQENGDILLKNEDTDDVIYTIPAPFALDGDGELAPEGAVYYTLSEGANKYTLTVTANADWMNSEDRIYPILIDPSLNVTESSEAALENINYAENSASDLKGNSGVTYFKISSFPEINANYYVDRVMLNIPSSALYGNSSAMYLYEVTDENGTLASRVTDVSSGGDTHSFNITELALGWIASPSSNYGVAITPAETEKASASTAAFSIQNSAMAVNTVTPYATFNYVSIKGLEDYFTYTSQSAGSAGNSSISHASGNLTVAIPTVSTMDSLMPYTATLVYNSLESNISHIYPNLDTAYTTQFLPYGFKLNVCETVVKKEYTDSATNTTKAYYVYEDSDGTGHAFFQSSSGSNIYIDNDGLQKTLTIDTANNIISITDDSKTIRTFTKVTMPNIASTNTVTDGWILTEIKDTVGNILTISYDSSHYGPTSISLKPRGFASKPVLKFLYTNGMLYAVYNPGSKDFVILRYSSTYNGSISTSSPKYLRQVDYGTLKSSATESNLLSIYQSESTLSTYATLISKSQYTYGSDGRILTLKDVISNQELRYGWTNGKVTTVSHYAKDTADNLGQQISLTYGTGYTDVKSTGNDEVLGTADDISTRYVFDENGRTVTSYSYSSNYNEIYGAVNGVYETQENVKNSLKEQTVLGGSSVNYILNGDFETYTSNTSFNYWTLSGNVERYLSTGYKNHGKNCLKFNPASGATSSATQYVSLKAGEYTLSMPYVSYYASDCTATVAISSISGSGLSKTERMTLNVDISTGSKSTFSTTFTVPNYVNGGDNIKITISFTEPSTSSVSTYMSIDDVMLVKGIGAAEFSHINYGSFDLSGTISSASATISASNFWTTNTGASPTIIDSNAPFGKAVKVNSASSGSTNYVKTRAYEINQDILHTYDYDPTMFSSNAGASFVLSGFAKAGSAAASGTFRLKADVVYYQGVGENDVIISYEFDFIPTVLDWQFTCGMISTNYDSGNDGIDYRCVKAIDIYCEYSKQPVSFALFDNISLVNSKTFEKYTHNEEGLLSSVETPIYREYYFYNANRNLIRVANNKGEMTDYTYDYNNLVSSVTDYDFMYLGTYDYPYYLENPTLTLTPKTKTEYSYNLQGKKTYVETCELTVSNGSIVEDTEGKLLIERYSYYSSADSYIIGTIKTYTDTSGVVTRYYYDESDGKLLAIANDYSQKSIVYTYNEKDELTAVTPATYSYTMPTPITNAENVNYSYDSKGQLAEISTDSTTYTFNYDVFGNSSSIAIGNNTLASYEYNENNGKLKKITYGNGYIVEYVYDRLENLKEIWYTNNGTRALAYSYEYTNEGQIYKYTDHVNGMTQIYKYDSESRLADIISYNSNEYESHTDTSISYNDKGNVSSIHNYFNVLSDSTVSSVSNYYIYGYHPDGRLNSTAISTKYTYGSESFTYDDFDRLSQKVLYQYVRPDDNVVTTYFKNTVDYTYKTDSTGTNTSMLVETYKSTVNSNTPTTYTYTYDNNNNITKIVYSTGKEIRYVYDDIGQLIREDNGITSRTYLYTYDNAGNITSLKTYYLIAAGQTPPDTQLLTTRNYGYTNSAWGDLLTTYHNKQLTYDNIGNPLTYYNGYNYTFTWNGRQLATATRSGVNYSFTYNADGMRMSKTKNGVTTNYYYNGSQLIYEETEGDIFLYVYDSNGSPIGLQYHSTYYAADNWDAYWFEKNLQGDVVAVYDEAGTKVVDYRYTAWGNVTVNSYVGSDAYITKNPFTYRGYYYDFDLGLYYLGSRYYDAKIGRFINADSVMAGVSSDVKGYNLYAYCFNDPVNMTDSSGNWPQWVEKTSQIFVAAFQSIEQEIGYGVGVGLSVSAGILGVEALYVEKDHVVSDDGITEFGHSSEVSLSVTVMFINLGTNYSNSHSFNDPYCTCDPMLDSFVDKATCPANEESYSDLSVSASLSLGAYLGVGGQVNLGFNLTEFTNRVINIFK